MTEAPRITAAYATDVGPRRQTNQDRAAVHTRDGVFLLADGMGGHADGHVAAEMAVRHVGDALHHGTPAPDALRAAFAQAHDAITQKAGDAERKMGTTLVALVVHDGYFLSAHVGDSRLYRLRDGHLQQLTKDHSYVQMLMDKGEISPEEADHHPFRHVLVKALGSGNGAEPDILEEPTRPGDRFVLCSDGMSNAVSPEEIVHTLNANDDPDTAAFALVRLALDNNTTDNVTVLVVNVAGG